MIDERLFRRFLARPWLPVGVPAVLGGTLLGWFVLSGSGVVATDPDRVDLIPGLGAVALPDGYLDEPRLWGEVEVGERFAGQEVGGEREWDVLHGTPAGPLGVIEGEAGHNLYRGDNRVFGPNVAGVGPHGVRGTGSLAVLFPRDQSRILLSLVRASGGTATLTFYARSGRRVGRVVLRDVENRSYAFRRRWGRVDIAGFTLENDDPRNGLGVAALRFEALNPLPVAGSPRRLVVFGAPLTRGAEGDAEGLEGALASALALFDASRVTIPRGGAPPPSPDAARVAAAELDAGYFVLARAWVEGGSILVRAALHGPSGREPLAVVEASGADVPAASLAAGRRLYAALLEREGRRVEAEAVTQLADPADAVRIVAAREALSAGLHEEALRRLGALSAAGVDFWAVPYTLSQALHAAGDRDGARESAERALAAGATPEAAARASAWLALLTGDARGSVSSFGRLTGRVSDADAWYGYVEALLAAPDLPGADRRGVLAAIRYGLRADGDHVGLIAHKVRLGLTERHPAYIDFWAGKVRRADRVRLTSAALELDLLIAGHRGQDDAFHRLAADARFADLGLRLRAARSVALWAERPDLALTLLGPPVEGAAGAAEARDLRRRLERAAGQGADLAAMLSCLPHRADGVGPAPDGWSRAPYCGGEAESAGDDPMLDHLREALAREAAGDAEGARRALDRIRGPDAGAIPWIPLRRLHLAVLAEVAGEPDEAVDHYRMFQRAWGAPVEGPAGEVAGYVRERLAWLR